MKYFKSNQINLQKYLTTMFIRPLLSASAIALLVASCTEPMDLNLDSTFTRLVVEGAITTDTGRHQILLSKTTDFFYSGRPPAVSGATVMISDGSKVINLTENPVNSGTYETDESFYGVVGRTYTLTIELEEEIGGYSTYIASCHIKPTQVPDSIRIEFQPVWDAGFWEVKLYAQDPPTKEYYKILVYLNGQLVNDSLHEVFALDDRLFNGNYINGFGVPFFSALPDENRLVVGDLVTLMIANITEDHTRFIWNARSESGFNTPLFSGPPANVKGNISNGGIGFFAAYQPRYISRVYEGD